MSALFKSLLRLIIKILFLTVFVMITVIGFDSVETSINEYQNRGIAISESILDVASDLILNHNPASIQGILNNYQTIDGVEYIIVRDEDLRVIAHTIIPMLSLDHQQYYASIDYASIDEYLTNTIYLKGVGRVFDITSPILEGELGFVQVGMNLDSIYLMNLKRVLVLIFIGFVIFIISIFWIRKFAKTISEPLTILTEYAVALSDHQFESPLDLQAKIKLISKRTKNELGKLASAFVKMENDMIANIRDLKSTLEAKQKIEADFKVAQQIQQHMLPQAELPKDASFIASGLMDAAKDVGGDFYDYFEKENGDLVFMIGDVSGKGVSAALFMAVTMTYLKAVSRNDHSPSEIITKVNALVAESNKDQLFVTCFFGMICAKTKTLTYVNAGHPAPYLISKFKTKELDLTEGLPIGVLEDFDYKDSSIKLQTQDILFLFTDGITEAENSDQELFDDQRLNELLNKPNYQSPKDVIDEVVKAVKEFESGVEQSDDTTALCIQVK